MMPLSSVRRIVTVYWLAGIRSDTTPIPASGSRGSTSTPSIPGMWKPISRTASKLSSRRASTSEVRSTVST